MDRYRPYALKCVRVAQDISAPESKLALLEMAQCWLRLAEQSTVISETASDDEVTVPSNERPRNR